MERSETACPHCGAVIDRTALSGESRHVPLTKAAVVLGLAVTVAGAGAGLGSCSSADYGTGGSVEGGGGADEGGADEGGGGGSVQSDYGAAPSD